MAAFKLYNIKEEDSLKLHVTISNLGDTGEQLYQFWIQLNYLLREYCPLWLYRDFKDAFINNKYYCDDLCSIEMLKSIC